MTAPFFGDFDVEDAFDTVPADPIQVARKLHGYRVLVDRLAGGDLPEYDDLPRREQDDVNYVGGVIVLWVAAHDPGDGDFAKAIHEAGRSRHGGKMWDLLAVDEKRLAFAFAALIAAWLQRQGAWQ